MISALNTKLWACYLQEAERKDAMFAKLNAVGATRSDPNGDGDDDVGVVATAPAAGAGNGESKSRRK
jgi:hypothetical protein